MGLINEMGFSFFIFILGNSLLPQNIRLPSVVGVSEMQKNVLDSNNGQ
jgi:hypothetical protein